MFKKIFSISAVIIFLVSITSTVNANDAKDWLNNEIDYILDVSNDGNITNTERFQYIENRVNRIFAGAGIAKFVAGKAWETADKDTKKNYLLAGFCYLKYNIGYALFLYLIISKKFKNLLLSMIPVIIGWLIYSYVTKSPIFINT